MIERALISVYDKTGLADLARGLVEHGAELVASGGTAFFLEERGLPVTRVEALTGVGELLGGRVKTLHPAIHAGILARRDRREDVDALRRLGIRAFDLVCVNLYPFAEVAGREGGSEAEAVEMIDIGGPALLRAAAKNFANVAALSSPTQYGAVLQELAETGGLSLATRRRLATEAFALTAAYEASIASWMGAGDPFPERLALALRKTLDLAYGENPHQRAAYYAEEGAAGHLLSQVEQLQGRPLSFNNLNDLAAASRLLADIERPACVIVKHANPCGVAEAATVEEAYERAKAADPVSAYGGVVCLNRRVSGALGRRLRDQFVEVLMAPAYAEEALAWLREKEPTRVLTAPLPPKRQLGERDFRRVPGGFLVQDADTALEVKAGMRVVCGQLDEATWEDLVFAWRVCKHVTSNAIVLAKGLRTLGIGAGQMSRVDAARIAVEKAQELGHDLQGAVLASDAFFPFPDGPEIALRAGVRAIIQPGGSKRDEEVIATVQAAGAAMVFTGRRHFRH
ncbi:MAG: bifunctional phosphoribosylaminoimidazolecarboxamide formyltransferase/inosine monophosphate cyclohydrolase [Thermoleophilia bacterium]